MISPNEAEMIANKLIENYLVQCEPGTAEDIANALTKLCSIAGIGICASAGYDDGGARLRGILDYIKMCEAGARGSIQ